MLGSPQISDDLRELVSLLNSHGVDYIIVGSHALAFHGVPRFTEDIDFFLERSRENIGKLAAALQDFGVELPETSQNDMLLKDRGVVFVGRKPNRVDFLTFLDGVEFESAARSKSQGLLANEPVFYISLEDYVATKKATGRPKDMSDLALLQSVYPELKP
jgi:predicted nucleotidyltransferase